MRRLNSIAVVVVAYVTMTDKESGWSSQLKRSPMSAELYADVVRSSVNHEVVVPVVHRRLSDVRPPTPLTTTRTRSVSS